MITAKPRLRNFQVLGLITLLVACGHAASQQTPNVNYSPPLKITKGGTYTGNWESQDPTTSAVTINTTEPVTITNCIIRSKSDLIKTGVSNAHVTISNCRGYGLDPGVPKQERGNFFFAYQIGSLVVEHNYIEATNFGVVLYATDGWSADGPLVVRYNIASNLDGAPSDGNGGRILTGAPFDGSDWGNHFTIFANYQNLQSSEIAWNEIISDPYTSWIGDIINIYSSSGTIATPLQVHDNFIQGGYPGVPTATLYYSGGITMDGRPTDTPATATAFVKIHDNQIVAHSNFGIGLAAGHDNEAYANRIVSTGQLTNGSWYTGYAGIYVMDCTCYQQPPSVYFNNFAHDNVVGFRFEWADPANPGAFSPPAVRQDYLLTDCAGGAGGPSSKCTYNVSLPDPITSATELNEHFLWQQKLSNNGIVVGPQSSPAISYEGLWWNAPAGSESGWGINLAHQGDVIFATWFTYDFNGKAWWLTMTANKTADGVYSGALVRTNGAPFSAYVPPAMATTVGTGTLTFTSATTGTFAYMVNDGANAGTQTKSIALQTFGPVPTCVWGAQPDLTKATNYQDLWWASGGTGSGWGVNLTQQGTTIFATWFTYDANHNPLWLSGTLPQTAPSTYSGALDRTSGPAFNAVPFDPTKIQHSPSGTATFKFTDGNAGSFNYAVDLSDGVNKATQTKAITRQVFRAPGTVCQ